VLILPLRPPPSPSLHGLAWRWIPQWFKRLLLLHILCYSVHTDTDTEIYTYIRIRIIVIVTTRTRIRVHITSTPSSISLPSWSCVAMNPAVMEMISPSIMMARNTGCDDFTSRASRCRCTQTSQRLKITRSIVPEGYRQGQSCKKITRSHTHTHRQRTTPSTPTHTHTTRTTPQAPKRTPPTNT